MQMPLVKEVALSAIAAVYVAIGSLFGPLWLALMLADELSQGWDVSPKEGFDES